MILSASRTRGEHSKLCNIRLHTSTESGTKQELLVHLQSGKDKEIGSSENSRALDVEVFSGGHCHLISTLFTLGVKS
jgi:hypothetical protein